MSGRHVAFLVFPDHGAVQPAAAIGRALVRRGHRVTGVVAGDHAGAVTAAGARAVTYRSRLGGRLADPGLAAVRESIEVVWPLIRDTFAGDEPDLVLYDFPSFFPARRLRRPAVQLFTGFAANEHFSPYAGDGTDPQPFIDLVAGALDDPSEVRSMLSGFDERNLVLLPRALQPLGETFDDRYVFTGHTLFPQMLGPAPALPGRSVWVVLGTDADHRPGLRELCTRAFAHPVLAVAPGHARDPGLVEWTCFREVLPHVGAAVCHSGTTTVVEALYFGKPVVFLEYTAADRVVGRRITELGIGRALPAGGLTPGRLRAAATTVAADSSVRRRIAAVRTEMLAEGGPERAAEAVGTWLSAAQLVNGR
jgi:hypothetical protein